MGLGIFIRHLEDKMGVDRCSRHVLILPRNIFYLMSISRNCCRRGNYFNDLDDISQLNTVVVRIRRLFPVHHIPWYGAIDMDMAL